jgi:hypothetical protein
VAADASEDERHEAYRAHVTAVVADRQVFLVKLADFVDNAGSLRYMAAGERRSRMTRKYAPLVPVFQAALATHRDVLDLAPDGVGQIRHHLVTIHDRLADDEATADGGADADMT